MNTELMNVLICGGVGALGGALTGFIGYLQKPEEEKFSHKKFWSMVIVLTLGGAVSGVFADNWKGALTASGLVSFLQGLKPYMK